MKYLIKNSFKVAHLSISGLDILSEYDYNEAKKAVQCLDPECEYSVFMGNHVVEIARYELENMLNKARPISDLEATVIEEVAGESFGKTLYSIFLKDPMPLLDEDSEEFRKLYEVYMGKPYTPGMDEDEEDWEQFDKEYEANKKEYAKYSRDPRNKYPQRLAKEASQTVIAHCRSMKNCKKCFACESNICKLNNPREWHNGENKNVKEEIS